MIDREAMLDAAERTIARDGPGASLEAIAEEAGVTKPIVYERVGTRAEVSDALAERLADRLVAAAGAGGAGDGVLDGPALAAMFGRVLQAVSAHRSLFLFVTRGSNHDTAERTLYLAGRSAEPLAEFLTAWRVERGLDPAVARPWAFGIVGMLNLVALWWMDEGTVPAEVLAAQIAELVWSGLDGA